MTELEEQVKKVVYDFKQALGQQSFYTFDLLKKHVPDEIAQQLVLKELGRIIKQFSGEVTGPTPSLKKVEEQLNQEILNENKKGNMIRVMEIEDDLTAVRRVRSIIERK